MAVACVYARHVAKTTKSNLVEFDQAWRRHLESLPRIISTVEFHLGDSKQMRNKTRILSFRVTTPLTSLTANAHILSTATAFKQGLSFIGYRPRDTWNEYSLMRSIVLALLSGLLYVHTPANYEVRKRNRFHTIFNDYVWNMQLIRIKVYRGRLNNCLMGLIKWGKQVSTDAFVGLLALCAKCKRIRKLADRWYIAQSTVNQLFWYSYYFYRAFFLYYRW